ncbi:TIGR02679 family protein [Kineococcus arenarius]|uniref:TIGR02679 family protein n=1 Tax=Kineococcus sp. SYSU DK007 TaxID=3383128 RepID=UPI003D7C8064
MSDTDDARLRSLLGGPESVWLRRRVRERLSAGKPLTGTASLREPTAAERSALERLLGRAPRGSGALSARLADVDAVLRGGAWPQGLASAVQHLDGPVVVRADAAAAAREAWEDLLRPLDDLVEREPRWEGWWSAARTAPSLRRAVNGADDAARLVADLRAVLTALPSPGEALGSLAQRTVRNPHGLDAGPLAGLVLSAAASLTGSPSPASAADRRAVWAAVGVALDDVSSTVLVAGLPGGGTATGHALEASRSAGLPTVLTLRHLTAEPARFPVTGRVVHACENPVVLSAALDRFGVRTPPLVCLAGRPSAAGVLLVRSLLSCGAVLRYHGDLDRGGLSIAASVIALGAQPWRLGVDDYRRAVRSAGRPLRGNPTVTPWDPELSAEVERTGLGVDEEAVLQELLDDLAHHAAPAFPT